MRIGVISDSHGNQDMLRKAFDLMKKEKVEMVFHLGDYASDAEDYSIEYDLPIETVMGNMDAIHGQYIKVVEKEGVRFLLTHGHTLCVNSTLRLLHEEAEENNCTAALYGHTHIPYNSLFNGILIINPGSISQPRGNSSKSLGIISIDDGNVNCEIHKL